MSTQQLVDRDKKMYGDTYLKGFNFGKPTDDFSKDPRYQSLSKTDGDNGKPPDDNGRTYYGQGGLPLGSTTQRQGGQVKDGKFVELLEKEKPLMLTNSNKLTRAKLLILER